ncbi:von Willebrand factor type A domain protein [bacterium BMS3Abin05]|nr:von Willebrand factor type A domain protein [bacterium BMS3Abin05]
MKRCITLKLFWVIGLILGLSVSVFAQAWFIPRPHPPRFPPPLLSEMPILEKETIRFSVTDQAGTVILEQFWKNPSDHTIEGKMLFPLPPGAQVTHFEMTIDDSVYSGKLYERNEARQIYEDIVRRLHDPGLLEFLNHNLFRTRLFPIPAHKTRRIQLKYQTVFPLDQGQVTIQLPLFMQKRRWLPGGKIMPVGRFVLTGTIRSKTPVKNAYSPDPDVEILQKSDHKLTVSLEKEFSAWKEKSFRLVYALQKNPVGLSLLTFRQPEKPGYFLLLISPAFEWKKQKPLPTDFVFLLDRSGSMSGEKIVQAKAALKFCLNHLKRGDRFGLVTFSSEVQMFRPELLPVKKWRKKALQFLDSIDARGGTNIYGALAALKKFRQNPDRTMEIIFLTDGKPTVGITDESRILNAFKKENTENLRLFVFGVGYDVNTFLLNHLSEEGRGTVVYVEPEANLETRISSFFDKIKAPVLTHLGIDWGDQEVRDIFPKALPDLFQGSQLVVTGRYEKTGDFKIALKGDALKQRKTFVKTFRFPEEAVENDFVPIIWASRKIGYLLDQIRWHGENPELKNEIIRLSKAFGIVTPYTSYLIQEPEPAGVLQAAGQPPAPPYPQFNRTQRRFLTDFASGRQEVSGVSSFYISKGIQNLKTSRHALRQMTQKIRFAAGRSFIFQDSVWVEQGIGETQPPVKVAFGSPAYFKLLEWHPGLQTVFALGQKVKFQIGNVVFEIAETGTKMWSTRESEKYRKLAR